MDKYEELGFMIQHCMTHPHEKVRYFCRDDMIPLCPECVTEHAKHDFVPANNAAAVEIRQNLKMA